MHSFSRRPTGEDENARGDIDRAIEDLTSQSDVDKLLVERLSDLSRAGASRLQEQWADIPLRHRLGIVRTMLEDAEANLDRNYDRVMLIALDDSDPETRRLAMEALWENESPALLNHVLDHVAMEPDPGVRAAQAMALGRFALLQEIDEFGDDIAGRLRDTLLDLVTTDPSLEVRRRSLESVAYVADDQEVVEQIEEAFDSGEYLMRVSALHAMGRQADVRWIDIVHGEMGSDEAEIRFEAVTAAGHIGDERSVPILIDLLNDEDGEVQLAAITAIGAIGGKLAVNTLRRLTADDNPAIAEAADDALEEAMLISNPLRPLF